MSRLTPLLYVVLMMSCQPKKTIDIQGHRGCRGLMPENSLVAFEKAIELGVHTLELDVVVSRDNVVVVSHEPFMNPEICLALDGTELTEMAGNMLNFYQMDYDRIRMFDCGSRTHPRFPDQQKIKTHKPTLDGVLKTAIALNPEIKFNIELKSLEAYYGVYMPYPEEFVRLVMEIINKNNAFNNCNLQSFDLHVLEAVHRHSPTMKVALLVDESEEIWGKMTMMSFFPEIISPNFKLLDYKVVRNLKAEGFEVIPWTVNEQADMQQLIDWGVDGIITDYPDRLVEIMGIEKRKSTLH